MTRTTLRLCLTLGCLLALSCSGGDSEKDGGPAPRPDKGTPDKSTTPDVRPAGIYRVAAVQYSSGQYGKVDGCTSDICALTKLTEQAAGQGAQLVVTPEYATDQGLSEPAPKVGDTPGSDGKWKEGSIAKTYAKLADKLDIISVFNLITEDQAGKLYNTDVAVGPDGKVLARHYKFELFGGESSLLTPGPDIATSFFDTPVGKAGLLICADAQCIVTNLQASPDCSSHAITLLKEYFAKKPKMVVFSAAWTIGGTGIWAAMNVQQKVAKDGNVWFVGANNIAGDGRGGGIWKPGGEQLKTTQSATPTVVMGDIPL